MPNLSDLVTAIAVVVGVFIVVAIVCVLVGAFAGHFL
jgi:hypothetical protein